MGGSVSDEEAPLILRAERLPAPLPLFSRSNNDFKLPAEALRFLPPPPRAFLACGGEWLPPGSSGGRSAFGDERTG